jgi:aryl-alcohol dehydrogenase-like predicted oxidoreductase
MDAAVDAGINFVDTADVYGGPQRPDMEKGYGTSLPDAPHRPPYAMGRDLAAMEQLVREGKVTCIGSSNFAGWDIATAQSVASARHFLGLASEQSLYNLSARYCASVLPNARHRVGASCTACRSAPLRAD